MRPFRFMTCTLLATSRSTQYFLQTDSYSSTSRKWFSEPTRSIEAQCSQPMRAPFAGADNYLWTYRLQVDEVFRETSPLLRECG